MYESSVVTDINVTDTIGMEGRQNWTTTGGINVAAVFAALYREWR